MADRILVVYASWTGFTQGVAQAVADVLKENGTEVDVRRVKDAVDVGAYHAVVVGSAVRAGKVNGNAVAFLTKHREALSKMPVAFFIVCMTMKEDTAEHRREVEQYLAAVQAQVPEVKFVDAGLFAGGMDPAKLALPMKLIMKAMKTANGDFRDWDAIRAWAGTLLPKLTGR